MPNTRQPVSQSVSVGRVTVGFRSVTDITQTEAVAEDVYGGSGSIQCTVYVLHFT